MVNKRLIQNQQMVLKALGFYTGKCDGIWSARTIEAKKDFESTPKFKPAYPNNGMPFELGAQDKLPAGLYFTGGGKIACEELTPERVREWESDFVQPYDNREQNVQVKESKEVKAPDDSKPKVVEQETTRKDQKISASTASPSAQSSTNSPKKKLPG